MSFKNEYEVVRVDADYGASTWTVIEYEVQPTLVKIADEYSALPMRHCKGGDFHWLSERLADYAKDGYEAGTLVHGKTTASEAIAHFERNGIEVR